MKHFFLAMIAFFLLSGCVGAPLSMLDAITDGRAGQVNESVIKRAALSIDKYCSYTQADYRLALRKEINDRTANGDIKIECL